ncbi:hypothetical protein JW979_05490 [bacterium]|nr:hypothetical protein [candidate division CSSED10-310 bacterium]
MMKTVPGLHCFLIMTLLISGIFLGCSGDEPIGNIDPLPSRMSPYLSTERNAAWQAFENNNWTEPGKTAVIRSVKSPESGATFYADIDHERNIIKLKSVRDKYTSIIFYDPYQQASTGFETNSSYVQSKCSCGGNRFQLAVGLLYETGKSGDDFSKFILAGTCTLCNETRFLFVR